MRTKEHILRVEREQQNRSITIDSNHPSSDGQRTTVRPFCGPRHRKGNEMEGSLGRIDGTTSSSFIVFNKYCFYALYQTLYVRVNRALARLRTF